MVYPIDICAQLRPDTAPPAGEKVRSPAQAPTHSDTVIIPGPLRSFLRMAGISQEIPPDEVLHMLARNASLYGYSKGGETEFLVLVSRYVHQARDLQNLATANGTIRITGCDNATPLLHVLGYRFQGVCGQPKT